MERTIHLKMNTETFTSALRALNTGDYQWTFAFYSAQKSKDGIEIVWNSCKMRGTPDWVETLRTTLLEKTLAEKQVAEYSPFLSDKETIAAIEKSNDVINEQITNILTDINHAEAYTPADFTTGRLPKVSGYGFYGTVKADESHAADTDSGGFGGVLFMRRGNPFVAGQKVRVCAAAGDEIITSETPVLKFSPVTDFVFIEDVCYFNSSSIEKDFELESRHVAIAEKRLGMIADSGIVSDYDKLEVSALSSKNARKFSGFDKEILDYISRLGIVEREEYLSSYGVIIDHEGRMDTSDPEQCDLIIDLLCCRSVVDPLGRLSTGSNITPRE